MIRITVELVSGIHSSRNRTLGVAEITNEGGELLVETSGRLSSYTVRLSKWAPKLSETWRRGRVERFDRKARGPWDLLFCALRATIGDRNP